MSTWVELRLYTWPMTKSITYIAWPMTASAPNIIPRQDFAMPLTMRYATVLNGCIEDTAEAGPPHG